MLPSGEPRVRNQIRWARLYLVRAGLVDSSMRGVWSLTQKGKDTQLDAETTSALFRYVQRQFAVVRKTKKAAHPCGNSSSCGEQPAGKLPIIPSAPS
jgi:restriction system protein